MNIHSYINQTVMTKDEKLLTYMKILSDKSRYKIILHLMQKGEVCVCVLSKKLGLEQTLISHHLQTLREAGLIQDRKVGTWVHCSPNLKTFKEIESLYQKVLSPQNIFDNPCVVHGACRQLLTEKQ